MLVFAAIIGFPTTLLVSYRSKCLVGNGGNEQDPQVILIDKVSFYLFMFGNFKDHGSARQNTFYFTFGLMLISLFFEKENIEWLTNRMGCTYNTVQKFIEMDIRKKCIDEGWPLLPKYNYKNYQMHYFYHDMDDLLERFHELPEESEKNRKRALKKEKTFDEGLSKDPLSKKAPKDAFIMKEVRDFVPYKAAMRIKEFIFFSVMIEGQSPDLDASKDDFIKYQRLKFKLQQEQIKINKELEEEEMKK